MSYKCDAKSFALSAEWDGWLTWMDWWMMCWTAPGWPGPALVPDAGLSTVGPLVLDITAAAAAPVAPSK